MSQVEEKVGGSFMESELFDQRLRDGEPLLDCRIEPPFNVSVNLAGVQIDAPCLQFKNTISLGVLRVTLTPLAALRLRDVLNQIEFAESPGQQGSRTLQ